MKTKQTPLTLDGVKEGIYAGFWPRFLAGMVDFLLLFLICSPLSMGLMSDFSISGMLSSRFFNFFILVLFNVFLVRFYGGSPGKLVMNIKIIQLNGKLVDWKAAILRESVNLIFHVFYLIGILYSVYNLDWDSFNSLNSVEKYLYFENFGRLTIFIGAFSVVWLLSEFVVLLLNKRKRAVHDFIGGTVVIKEKYETAIREAMTEDIV